MDLLYADNYRGFSDSLIPLKDVNFFVGENSTGKTSILSILKVLHSQEFWFNGDFSVPGMEFGFFDDIVSKNSKQKDSFTVGLLTKSQDERNKFMNAFAIRFLNVDSSPFPKEIRYTYSDFDIHLKSSKASIHYKLNRGPNFNQDNKDEVFRNWISEFKTAKKGFKQFKVGPIRQIFHKPYSVINYMSHIILSKDLANKAQPIRSIDPVTELFSLTANWTAPIRSKPKGLYQGHKVTPSPEGDHAPFVLKKILKDTSKGAVTFRDNLKEFGKESGLFDTIKTKPFGKGPTAPFELNVSFGSIDFKLNTVGYGISQILPILTETMLNRSSKLFIIQQPEVHLHPRAQAAFGEVINKENENSKKRFCVETHSDFVIDRFRLCLSKRKQNTSSAQVLFFERVGSNNRVTSIKIDKKGRYSENQPDAFREFFLKEQLNLLDI